SRLNVLDRPEVARQSSHISVVLILPSALNGGTRAGGAGGGGAGPGGCVGRWRGGADPGWLCGPHTRGACGLASCDDRAMGPAEGSGAVAGRVARPGTGGRGARPGVLQLSRESGG